MPCISLGIIPRPYPIGILDSARRCLDCWDNRKFSRKTKTSLQSLRQLERLAGLTLVVKLEKLKVW